MSDPINGIKYGSTCEQATSPLSRFAKGGQPFSWAASGLAVAMLPGAARANRERMELEEAAMRMAALCSSAEMFRIASGEAERREALMDRTAAMRSVADDLATGRLRYPR